jgi:TonB-dependent receptor
MSRIGRAYLEHPEYFQLFLPVSNFFSAYVTNTRHFEEQVDAAFLMGTATLGRASFRAGLRWEQTGTDALEWDPLSNAEVRAAGFPATSRATTIPGIIYQFFTNPRIHRTGEYDNLFPSASFKYNFNPNFSLHAGYSSTIRRPQVAQIAGVFQLNDQTLRATVPNVNLKPETSDNLSARLAYYFEPVGLLAVSVYQNSVQDLHQSSELTAAEFGNTDPELAAYTFVTTDNSAERVKVRGLEVEYSQSLSFLPSPFKGLTLRASYTRNYAEVVTPSMAPHGASGGLSYAWRRISASLNARWTDNVPTNSTGSNYVRHRTTLDLSSGYRLTNRYSLFASARNLTNAPYLSVQKPDDNPALRSSYQVFGVTWTFGVKGVF